MFVWFLAVLSKTHLDNIWIYKYQILADSLNKAYKKRESKIMIDS